jgi:hypothetical protein
LTKIYKENKLWEILIIKEFIDFNDSLHIPSTVSTSLPILNDNTRNYTDTETLLRMYLNEKRNEKKNSNENENKNEKKTKDVDDHNYKIYKEKHIKRNHAKMMLQQRIRNHEATLWSRDYNISNAWGPYGPPGGFPNGPFQGPVPGGPLGPFGNFKGPFGSGLGPLNGPAGVFNGLHGPFNPVGGFGGPVNGPFGGLHGPSTFSDPLTPLFDRHQN